MNAFHSQEISVPTDNRNYPRIYNSTHNLAVVYTWLIYKLFHTHANNTRTSSFPVFSLYRMSIFVSASIEEHLNIFSLYTNQQPIPDNIFPPNYPRIPCQTYQIWSSAIPGFRPAQNNRRQGIPEH